MKDACIIIPTCNRPVQLSVLVQQLTDQMRKKDRLILVNDGKPDSLPVFGDTRILTVEHCKPYFAVASANNAGIDLALEEGYEWGIFVDDDSTIADNWLEAHRRAWSDIKTLYVGKQWDVRAKKGEDIRAHWRYPDGDFPTTKEEMPLGIILMMALLNCSLYLPSLEEVGGVDEDFDGAWGWEDTELSYRLLVEEDWSLEYLEDALLKNHRAPPGSDYDRNSSNNAEVLKSKLPAHVIDKVF